MQGTRSIHAGKFLETHFAKIVRSRFFMAGGQLPIEEVFDETVMLYPIAMAADSASKSIFGRAIVESVEALPDSTFGYVPKLREDIMALDIMLLVASAEDLFGIDANSQNPDAEEIDLEQVIHWLLKPESEGGATWRQ